MSFETAQAQYDRQMPEATNETPCANCGERQEEHVHETSKGGLVITSKLGLCPANVSEIVGYIRDENEFQEMSEDEMRDDARLRAAGL